MNAIAKLLKVSTPAVLKWIRTFAENHWTQRHQTETAVVIEMKQILYSLEKSLANFGSGNLIVAIKDGP